MHLLHNVPVVSITLIWPIPCIWPCNAQEFVDRCECLCLVDSIFFCSVLFSMLFNVEYMILAWFQPKYGKSNTQYRNAAREKQLLGTQLWQKVQTEKKPNYN